MHSDRAKRATAQQKGLIYFSAWVMHRLAYIYIYIYMKDATLPPFKKNTAKSRGDFLSFLRTACIRSKMEIGRMARLYSRAQFPFSDSNKLLSAHSVEL